MIEERKTRSNLFKIFILLIIALVIGLFAFNIKAIKEGRLLTHEDIIFNEYFTKNEIRLIRRLVRDRKFRGATAEFTFYLWETVRENEEKNIFPNKDICEIQIDSFMGYELFLMKNYLINTLFEIDKESKYYEKAMKLLNKLSHLDEIDYEYIPKGSLYTEFLGKK